MNEKLKAHIVVLLGNFFFGAAVVAIKHITPSLMPPLAVNVIRVSVALSLFWLLYFLKPSSATIQKKHIPLFIICALTGVAINQIMFVKGTALTSSIHTSLLALSTPIAITVIAAWLLKEKITLNKSLGLLLGIAGACILILLKASNDKESSTIGDVLIIFNAVSYAFYLVLVKPLMESYKPLHVIRWVFLLGAIVIIPVGYNDFTQVNWAAFLWHHWFALGFVVIGATFLAYMFMVYGIATLGSSVVGTYIYTQPIFATITSMILFGEKLTATKIIAAILIFSGVFLVNFKKKNA
ncbi:MAG: DMT family transporter [Chitinophagaceae bacterium]|jgi:drug/metabolite transporter (DMT)-like permease|nr:DMT family transporter [Chitinophagaceae bacterium]